MMNSIKQSVVVILVLICSTAFSQTGGLDALKSKARGQNKNILIYFSGSDWCAPCIKFKNKFIETDAFRAFAEKKLLVYNADFPRKKANQLSTERISENEKLADLYNPAGSFPMIVLINSGGKVLRKWERLPTVSLEAFIKELE